MKRHDNEQHATESSSNVEPTGVGVVIPVYNRATVILATLEAVARQSARPETLVVVDDGSTDETVEAVGAWIGAARPPFPVQTLKRPHESAAAARNAGMAVIGDLPFVAFLDSDDCWPDNFLERTAAVLRADSQVVAATVDRRFIDSFGKAYRYDDCRKLVSDPIAWFFRHGAGVASSTLFRTAAIRAAGGWNSELQSAEDSMLFSLVALEGPWRHSPGDPVEFHHGNAEAISEEGNLHLRHSDRLRRWAGVYEQIYDAVDGRYPNRQHDRLRRLVANYWYRAGKQLDTQGKPTEAHECFDRALEWNPTMLRAWRRRWLAAR